MKNKTITSAAVGLVLCGITIAGAQDSDKNLRPVFPGDPIVRTNVIVPSLTNGITRSTNSNINTNVPGIGAPGRNGGLDSGEGKGQRGVGEAPPVGTAPGPGKAPGVGDAPPVGTPPPIRDVK
jgi:hypothetical protein